MDEYCSVLWSDSRSIRWDLYACNGKNEYRFERLFVSFYVSFSPVYAKNLFIYFRGRS